MKLTVTPIWDLLKYKNYMKKNKTKDCLSLQDIYLFAKSFKVWIGASDVGRFSKLIALGFFWRYGFVRDLKRYVCMSK